MEAPKQIMIEVDQFFKAAAYGKRTILQKFIESGSLGPEGINMRDSSSEEQYTALHYAVKEGKFHVKYR